MTLCALKTQNLDSDMEGESWFGGPTWIWHPYTIRKQLGTSNLKNLWYLPKLRFWAKYYPGHHNWIVKLLACAYSVK